MRKSIEDQKAFYRQQRSPGEIRCWQLNEFNRQWKRTLKEVPYFRALAEAKNLPDRFSDWQQFRDLVPLMDRRIVQERQTDLVSSAKPPDQWRSTGGSTAEPLQIPIWKSETSIAASDLWYARSWFGVTPADKLFLVWGHSHLLGSGLKGRWNGFKRRAQDLLLGYRRWSAYELGDQRLQEAGDELLRFRPDFVLGYAVAMDRLARANQHRADELRRLRLKVVVATAESFPRSDSARQIAELFQCPVAMEYGAVETGPIAHQQPSGAYHVLWRHLHLEGRESPQQTGAYEIFVTSLYPRALPLIRYRIGDLISSDPNAEQFDQQFEMVIGRCNDFITVSDGSVVHSEAFTHALKDISAVSAFQVVQSSANDVSIEYVANRSLNHEELSTIHHRLMIINPRLGTVSIEQRPSLPQTVAGKTRKVLRHSAAGTESAQPATGKCD